MEKTKHTPGPRTVEIGADAIVRCADGRTFNFGDAIYHPDNVANAYLDAAAPDLLRELESLQWSGATVDVDGDDVNGCPSCGAEEYEGHYMRCGIAAALARATGKAVTPQQEDRHG